MICLAMLHKDVILQEMIEGELGISCVTTTSLSSLLELLVQERLTAFAVDTQLLEREPRMAELAWCYAGTTLSVIVDPRNQDTNAIIRELRVAILRRDRNREQAREEERARFAAKLADPLGAMLINLGIVLEDQKLARTTRIRIERVLHAAETLQAQIGPPKAHPRDTRPAPAPKPRLVKSMAASAGAGQASTVVSS